MTKRRILIIAWLLVFGSLLGGAAWLWDHRHYWLLHNFRVVDEGRVYAGGYQYPGPLTRIVKRYGIRTVLCLREDPTERTDEIERQTLARLGVRFQRVVIPFDRSRSEQLAALEKCLRILLDPECQPVFVHCWGGQHRVGVVVGAYRARAQRMGEEAIWREFDKFGGNTADPPYAQNLLRAFLRRENVRRERRQRVVAREKASQTKKRQDATAVR